jgi:hypothetical protein
MMRMGLEGNACARAKGLAPKAEMAVAVLAY